MRFSLRPEHPSEDDLFGPLRELRSPLSMEKIKTLVFHHAAGQFSIWNHHWTIAAGIFAVGAIAGVVYHFSGNVPTREHSITQASIGSEHIFRSPIMERSPSKVPDNTWFDPRDIPRTPASQNTDPSVIKNILYAEGRSLRMESSVIKSLDVQIKNPIPSSSFISPEPSMLYASVSSGAIFSHLRIVGEEAEIGINSGWESIGIAFTNASGNRDWHDVLAHRSSPSSLLYSESDQTIALFVGANYSIGPVAVKTELGPAYLFTSSKFIDPVTEALGSSSVNNKIGMAAEISAFYHVSDFFQAGVTSIASYRIGQFTSGILVSVTIRP
jgi:hypothetical protein